MSDHRKKTPISNQIRFAALAVDAVCIQIMDDTLKILIAKIDSYENPYTGQWAHVGGLIRVDETAEQSVERLLQVKAGMHGMYKEQLCTFSDVDRDPRGRVVSVAYLALMNETSMKSMNNARLKIKWVKADDLSGLAYDHDKITRAALDRLKSKILYTDILRHLMPEEFTLLDLQRVYEIVLGETVDKRNFRKKILTRGMLENTGKTRQIGIMRPAALYIFK